MKTIAIIGSGVHGNIAAAFFRKEHPRLRVVVIGPEIHQRPIVGESLTEFSDFTLREIGLESYLETEQFKKYGLTYYFKENINRPEDRRYAVVETPAIPPMPSHQLNRFAFDEHLMECNRRNGVEFVVGRAVDVTLDPEHGHRLEVELADGSHFMTEATWLVDASGRSRFLARKLHLDAKPPYQRCAFWFRLVDFEQSLIARLDAVKPPQHGYDPYFVTHHFMGHGNWIWCIPMSTTKHRNMISIGVVWRPDIHSEPVRSVDQFLEQVAAEHPVIAELVKSGSILDSNLYANYLYEASQVYSADRWFLVGDAGDCVDPLYSTGFVSSVAQIRQVSAAIGQDLKGRLDTAYVESLETAYRNIHHETQYEIGALYEVMDDPYQCSWRIQIAIAFYFYFLLPAYLNGYLNDRFGADFVTKAIALNRPRINSIRRLIGTAARRRGHLQAEQIPNIYREVINWDVWGPSERDMATHLSRLSFLFVKYRWRLLREAGFEDWPLHLSHLLQDFATGLAARCLVGRRSLRRSPLIRLLVRPPAWLKRRRTDEALPMSQPAP